MLLLNFSHPLTTEHLTRIEDLTGQRVDHVVKVPVLVDPAHPLGDQVVDIADAAGLAPDEWQTLPLVVNLPGYAPAAVALLAEIHGRMGHFPTVLWLRPVRDGTPTQFEVSGLVNLQALRDSARIRRQQAHEGVEGIPLESLD